jgi:hypothetical protein
MHITVFRLFFYTVSYRNLKLSMMFFRVKLHIEFAFHHRDPYGSGVAYPWIFYYRTYACNSFPGYFSTPFHIGTWNFPWGSSELSYKHTWFFSALKRNSAFCQVRFRFLAHLSWKLKWAFLIAFCPSSFCPSICLSVNFYIFDLFSRTTGPILTRLGTNDPWAEGILNCSNEGDCPSSRGDNSKRVKIFWNFKKSSPEPAGQFQLNLV